MDGPAKNHTRSKKLIHRKSPCLPSFTKGFQVMYICIYIYIYILLSLLLLLLLFIIYYLSYIEL